jgi:S-methylmethionine-dependent homocysteine/selenocysteine methylase
MRLEKALAENRFILAEAAVIETLRRTPGITLDPELANSPLIYEARGRRLIAGLINRFIGLARQIEVPIVVTTPTWRANRERLVRAREERDVNGDAVAFIREIQAGWPGWGRENILVGGLMSCRNDCYRPDLALTPDAAEKFHAWQARRLAAAGVDFLIAQTLPALSEALGLARALAATGVPYLISFVIDSRGLLLDGQTLEEAVAKIDSGAFPVPAGYMINCAWPGFLKAETEPESVLSRLVGFQANAACLDPGKLDNSPELKVGDLDEWARRMAELNRRFGLQILGGCCGTGSEHLERLVREQGYRLPAAKRS